MSEGELTTWIRLEVPNALHYSIKSRADKETMETGDKKTIHDEMIETLKLGDKERKKQKN